MLRNNDKEKQLTQQIFLFIYNVEVHKKIVSLNYALTFTILTIMQPNIKSSKEIHFNTIKLQFITAEVA